MKIYIGIILIVLSQSILAQKEKAGVKSMFDKTAVLGFSFNNSWVTYRDALDSSFLKPALGIHFSNQVNLSKNFALFSSLGLQMRGTGVYTTDSDNSVGNPDSTGRLRYNIRAIELPVMLQYRMNREIFLYSRLTISLGIVPMYHYTIFRKWYSVDDGFHDKSSLRESYRQFDLPIRASLGFDVDAPGGNLFKINAIVDYGIIPIRNDAKIKQFLAGINMSFLF